MADTVTGTVGGQVSYTRTPGSGIFTGKAQAWQDTFQFAARVSGVLADQCDLAYVKRHVVGATSSVVIDLTAAVGDDGVTSHFARVRAIAIRNASTTDGQPVTLDNAGQTTNPFTGLLNSAGVVTVAPSTAGNTGFLILAAPNTTGAAVGTGVNVRVSNPNAASVTVDVVILGCSA